MLLLVKRPLSNLRGYLPQTIQPLKKAIYALAENPRPHGCKKLRGRPGYRIRQGNYRIIYELFEQRLSIEVIAIGHRKSIYLN